MTMQMEDYDVVKRVEKLSQSLATFIAHYEQSDDKLQHRQLQSEHQIQNFSKIIDEQVKKINTSLTEISEVMTAAGAARWRVAAEQALKEGEAHSAKLQEIIKEFERLIDKNLTRLDHVTLESERRIAKVLSAISIEQEDVIENLRLRAESSYQSVSIIADETMKSFKNAVLWLRVERFGIAAITAILVTFLMGLYVNAEWPWEASVRAQQERTIGKTVFTTWPTLTKAEQEQVITLTGIKMKDNKL